MQNDISVDETRPWRREVKLSILSSMFKKMILSILSSIHDDFREHLFSDIEELMENHNMGKIITKVKNLLIQFHCYLTWPHTDYGEIKKMVTRGLDEKYGFEEAINCYLDSLSRVFIVVRNKIIDTITFEMVDYRVIKLFNDKFDYFAKFDQKYRMQY